MSCVTHTHLFAHSHCFNVFKMPTRLINKERRPRKRWSYIYEETIERRGALVYLNYTPKLKNINYIEMTMMITSVNEVRGDKSKYDVTLCNCITARSAV
jgi:hypothetical protein